MKTDAPCPHCHGVHYSSYNAQRCATRHRIFNELATYDEQNEETLRYKQETAEIIKRQLEQLNNSGS